MKRDIIEGMVKKGGLNNKPKGKRPSPPKGQGTAHIRQCKAEICALLDKIDAEVQMVTGIIGDRVQSYTRDIRRKLSPIA